MLLHVLGPKERQSSTDTPWE